MALTEMERAAIKAHQELQDKDELSYYNLFKAGAEWQRNHVWHEPSEEPTSGARIIILYSSKLSAIGHYASMMRLDESMFEYKIRYNLRNISILNVKKWAYLKDLAAF